MEKAPLPSESQPEKRALFGISPIKAPNIEVDHGKDPGSIMKLCLREREENVEGPGTRVDMKLLEMDSHMSHLRYETSP